MSRRPLVRHILLTFTTLLLLVLAWQAIAGGVDQLPRAQTAGQHVETIVQLTCGLLSVLAALTCFWGRQWARPVRIAWGLSLVATAVLSSLVWGPPMLLITVLFGVVTSLVALAVIWAMRAATAA